MTSTYMPEPLAAGGAADGWRWTDALLSGGYSVLATNNRQMRGEPDTGGITTYRGITSASHLCPSPATEACHP
jgi:hypothetical protein